VELSGYLAVARRWWWTLLVATWVAAISGYVVASQIPPTYEAEAQLLVGPYNTDVDTLRAAGNLVQTYADLVTTTPLLESAIAETRANILPTDLRLRTRVTANDTTRFLTIRVQDTNAAMAAKLANALSDEITQLASRGTNRPEGILQSVEFAVPPIEPIAPQKSLIVGLAALAALIGAMVLVMLVEYLSAAVRSEDELDRLTGLPFLGKVDVSRAQPSSTRGLIDQAPESAGAAAYRLVLAKATFGEAGRPARSLVVIGTTSDGTSSQVAANLAAIMARGGRQVVLVDADATDLSATRIFGLLERPGLSDLTGNVDIDPSLRLVRISSTLRVLPRGATLDQDAIDVDRATSILGTLRTMADLVVVSTGPLHLSAGALAWAQAADSTIVVAARDQARRDDVEYAAESLKLVGVDKAGTILVERKRAIRRVRPTAAPSEGSRPIVREPIREPVRQMYREPRPEPRPELRFEPLREPYREPSPQPYREPTPEPIREPSPEPLREPSPEPFREPSPEPFREPSPEPYRIVRDDVDEPLELDQRPPRPEPKSPTRRTPRRRGQPDRPSA
jgi:capsular polysaccharide biosynthesis protein